MWGLSGWWRSKGTLGMCAAGRQAQHRVMRGTWFMEKGPDWVPLTETVADELETAYRSEVLPRPFSPHGTSARSRKLRVLLRAARQTPLNVTR